MKNAKIASQIYLSQQEICMVSRDKEWFISDGTVTIARTVIC